jgi:hypothetical protein
MPKIGVYPLAGVPAQMDDTDKLAVSLYGKSTNAGDTALLTHATRGLKASINSVAITDADNTGNNYLSLSDIDNNVLQIKALLRVFNGVGWDRQRGTLAASYAASAARTATLTGADQVNYNHRGLIITVNITARAAATTLTLSLQFKDPVSGEYVTVFTAAAPMDSADATFTYVLMTGTIVTTGSLTEKINMPIARTSRITVTPSDANSVTYSVATDWQV